MTQVAASSDCVALESPIATVVPTTSNVREMLYFPEVIFDCNAIKHIFWTPCAIDDAFHVDNLSHIKYVICHVDAGNLDSVAFGVEQWTECGVDVQIVFDTMKSLPFVGTADDETVFGMPVENAYEKSVDNDHNICYIPTQRLKDCVKKVFADNKSVTFA